MSTSSEMLAGGLILSEPLSAQMLVAAAIIVVTVMVIIARIPAGELDQSAAGRDQGVAEGNQASIAPFAAKPATPADQPAFAIKAAAAAPDCE